MGNPPAAWVHLMQMNVPALTPARQAGT